MDFEEAEREVNQDWGKKGHKKGLSHVSEHGMGKEMKDRIRKRQVQNTDFGEVRGMESHKRIQ